ncbi:hypothetical protein [Ruegeria arenilitoris]|uniref:hypothetical protein n=1 Tax=Ruegeria arenilitoris TaxID=1173585 RepID=UPI00147E9D0A|nr:hypothetical protein [Ruegeria arenilitoris]
MKRALILTVAIVIASAANAEPGFKTIKTAKATLTGAPAELLETCIGEPAAVVAQEGQKIVAYSSVQERDADGRTMPTPGAADAPKACIFTFTIKDGVITVVDSKNRAGWGGGSITKCADLVKACTSKEK